MSVAEKMSLDPHRGIVRHSSIRRPLSRVPAENVRTTRTFVQLTSLFMRPLQAVA